MLQDDAFNFSWADLPTTNFDEVFLAVNHKNFAINKLADVSSANPIVAIKRFQGSVVVFEITQHRCWAFDNDVSKGRLVTHSIAIFINNSIECMSKSW